MQLQVDVTGLKDVRDGKWSHHHYDYIGCRNVEVLSKEWSFFLCIKRPKHEADQLSPLC